MTWPGSANGAFAVSGQRRLRRQSPRRIRWQHPQPSAPVLRGQALEARQAAGHIGGVGTGESKEPARGGSTAKACLEQQSADQCISIAHRAEQRRHRGVGVVPATPHAVCRFGRCEERYSGCEPGNAGHDSKHVRPTRRRNCHSVIVRSRISPVKPPMSCEQCRPVRVKFHRRSEKLCWTAGLNGTSAGPVPSRSFLGCVDHRPDY